MTWVRIDDRFSEHPKVLQAGPLGLAMHVSALCYCGRNLTDGFIPAAVVPALVNLDGIGMRMWAGEVLGGGEDATAKLVLDDLLASGLWEEDEGGYRIHDYLDFQPSRTEVLRVRASRSQSGRVGGREKHKRAVEKSCKQTASKQPSKTLAKVCPGPVPGPVPVPVPVAAPAADNSEPSWEGNQGLRVGRIARWIGLHGSCLPDSAGATLVEPVLANLSADEAEQVIKMFFADTDDWLVKHDHPIRALKSDLVNRYLRRIRKADPKPVHYNNGESPY